MRILVMGAGAVGSAIGGFLSQHHEVLLVGRGSHIDAIQTRGLRIEGILGNSFHKPQACHDFELESREFIKHPLDWVLITVKSTATEDAIRQLVKTLPDPSLPRYVHIQNGLGNFECIKDVISRQASGKRPIILSGMTITGYDVVEDGRVAITVYGGPGKIGSLADKGPSSESESAARELVDLLSETPLVFEYTETMLSFLWAKFLYNCCLNPLGALLKVAYGKLRLEPTLQIMRQILIEAFALARAENVSLFWSSPDEYFQHLLNTLIPATAEHEPSMLADLNRGRKTEIQALNGYLVQRSKMHGLDAPVNETLVRLIAASSVPRMNGARNES